MNTFKKYRILVILNLSFARKDKKGLSLATVVFKFVISHTSVSLYNIITTIYCHRNRLLTIVASQLKRVKVFIYVYTIICVIIICLLINHCNIHLLGVLLRSRCYDNLLLLLFLSRSP